MRKILLSDKRHNFLSEWGNIEIDGIKTLLKKYQEMNRLFNL